MVGSRRSPESPLKIPHPPVPGLPLFPPPAPPFTTVVGLLSNAACVASFLATFAAASKTACAWFRSTVWTNACACVAEGMRYD